MINQKLPFRQTTNSFLVNKFFVSLNKVAFILFTTLLGNILLYSNYVTLILVQISIQIS